MYPEDGAQGKGGGAMDCAAVTSLFAKLFSYQTAFKLTLKENMTNKSLNINCLNCVLLEKLLTHFPQKPTEVQQSSL